MGEPTLDHIPVCSGSSAFVSRFWVKKLNINASCCLLHTLAYTMIDGFIWNIQGWELFNDELRIQPKEHN